MRELEGKLPESTQDGQHGAVTPLDAIDSKSGHLRSRPSPRAVYIGNNEAIACLNSGLRIYVDTQDVGISSHLMTVGDWEPWIRTVLMGFVKPGMRVLDIGANFGFYTLLMARAVGAKGEVFAVEANPHLLRLLRRSIRINGVAQRIRLIEKAAFDRSASLSFSYQEQWLGGGRLAKTPSSKAGVVTVDVDAIALDSLIKGPVDVIKIDIEGGEELAIRGMSQLIDDSPSLKIVMEYSKSAYLDPRSFWMNFQDKGFKVRLIEPFRLSGYLSLTEVLAVEEDTRYLLVER
jgi:FkbM family methyltransferase